MKEFLKICKMSQDKLRTHCAKVLRKYYGKDGVTVNHGYIYAVGENPILLTAHLDTVHNELPHPVMSRKDDKTIISAKEGIGGDDRCGVWIILNIIRKTDLRPSILFCEDEEIGGIGSAEFTGTELIEDVAKRNKFLVELDRKGNSDAVYYNCGNDEFRDFIEKITEFKEEWGSFSDIGNLSPRCDLASVNLSVGYYNQHTEKEYVVFEEMEHTRDITIKMIKKSNKSSVPVYDYQEECFGFGMYREEGYMFSYFDDITNKIEYETYFGNSDETLLMLLCDHPNVCMNDIIDVAPI